MHNGVTTTELDLLSAETCAYMSQRHPDYSKLAARIAVSNLHKNSPERYANIFLFFIIFWHRIFKFSMMFESKISNYIQMSIITRFSEAIDILYKYVDDQGRNASLISEDVHKSKKNWKGLRHLIFIIFWNLALKVSKCRRQSWNLFQKTCTGSSWRIAMFWMLWWIASVISITIISASRHSSVVFQSSDTQSFVFS